MWKRLVIVGAGGHGKVVADIALKNQYKKIIFLDDNAAGTCLGFPILGTSDEIMGLDDGNTEFVIAVGSNHVRKKIAEGHLANWVTLIHPSAQIGAGVRIGNGTVVMAGAVINPGAVIGEHCIINTGAVIEHDDVLSNYVHVSPNAVLGGTIHIGDCTHIGIGAVVRNNINICDNCIIGAGAVVVGNITENATYVGIPAEKFSGRKL